MGITGFSKVQEIAELLSLTENILIYTISTASIQ